MRRPAPRTILSLILVGWPLGCAAGSPMDASATIEPLLYSGRPDPSFTLEGAEASRLGELLAQAQHGERVSSEPPSKLGYRGFRVVAAAGEFQIGGGVIARADGTRWRDGEGVEAWLLVRARERGFGKVLEEGGAPKP